MIKNVMSLGLTPWQKWQARLALVFFSVMMLPSETIQTILSPYWDAALSAVSLLCLLYTWTRNASIEACCAKIREFAKLTALGEEIDD